ncbi:MAG: DUF1850 domain-containing protein [Desulfurococcales archaeon]|nr:DUF1850 domain-containing protein [Desulfurococcales archaeon]
MNRKVALILALALLGAVTAGYSLAPHLRPEGGAVTDNERPKLLLECDGIKVELSLTGNEKLEYNWTHSVEGTPIVEIYKVTPEGLTLIETRAKSFGAGHPYNAEEIGGVFKGEVNGWLVYTANYTIGPRLEIMGSPDFPANITVWSGDRWVSCSVVEHALIIVTP